MQSKAKTVAAYLKELPSDRRRDIEAVRKVILENLPKGYREEMSYGMIGYVVPHSLYPAGYHCNPKLPLPFGGLASQKNYMSLYVMSLYGSVEQWFREEYRKSGKKQDIGKCCVRFRKLEDLPLDVVGRLIASVPVDKFIEWYEESRDSGGMSRTPRKRASKNAATKKAPPKKKRPARSKAAR